ncbi:carboxylating nicotinate-nucleotide diphosphorylase [Methylophilaceae bacterium]|jgi:nicotinate-nucleotide pyrophosphorylase (carboxylating)|nr:carboxylating nicotinate-nucleotide diphosphorylase [Methylophilaceae bacterium]
MQFKYKLKLLQEIKKHISLALLEDLGSGDLTKSFIPPKSDSLAKIITRQDAIFCGKLWINEIIKTRKSLKIKWLVKDGQKITKNQSICEISGSTRDILAVERVCLNYIQVLSGTATTTNTFVNLIKHTKSKVFDTRKTLPGMRLAQKYAVKVGGGQNQRLGLYDNALFKENHITANGSLLNLLEKLRQKKMFLNSQIEVESMDQLTTALKYPIKNILLDNFSVSDVNKALQISDHKINLEISGNINKRTILKYASLGKLRISVGLLTKDIQAIDFSMLIQSKKTSNT